MYPTTPGDDKVHTPRAQSWARENFQKSGPKTTGNEATEESPSSESKKMPHWLRYLLRSYKAEEARKERRKKLRRHEIPETRDPPPPPPPPAEEPSESGHE